MKEISNELDIINLG